MLQFGRVEDSSRTSRSRGAVEHPKLEASVQLRDLQKAVPELDPNHY